MRHDANAMKPEDMWLQLAQNRTTRRPEANLDLHIASNCIHDTVDAKNSIGAKRTGRSRDGYDADVRACDKQWRRIIDVLAQNFDPYGIAFGHGDHTPSRVGAAPCTGPVSHHEPTIVHIRRVDDHASGYRSREANRHDDLTIVSNLYANRQVSHSSSYGEARLCLWVHRIRQ